MADGLRKLEGPEPAAQGGASRGLRSPSLAKDEEKSAKASPMPAQATNPQITWDMSNVAGSVKPG